VSSQITATGSQEGRNSKSSILLQHQVISGKVLPSLIIVTHSSTPKVPASKAMLVPAVLECKEMMQNGT